MATIRPTAHLFNALLGAGFAIAVVVVAFTTGPHPPLVIGALVLCALGFSGVSIAFGKTDRFVLDGIDGTLTIHSRSLAKRSRTRVPLDQIKAAVLRSETHEHMPDRAFCKLTFEGQDGTDIPFGRYVEYGPALETALVKINAWLEENNSAGA